MAEPVWGQLEKAQDDPETIEEAIERFIDSHEADAGAHTGAGESLETHKTQDVIDHPAESVVEDKIIEEAVINKTIESTARAFTAIVDAGGDGDYTDIQSAIDYVNGLGGGRIFIKDGTYTLSANIVMYSNVQIMGESQAGVILDFNGTTYYFSCEGAGNDSPSGTIALTYGDTEVVGTSTDFVTEVDVGDYIKINDVWYEVDSITDATHLELIITYRGEDQSGLNYIIGTPLKNIRLEKFSIVNSDNSLSARIYWVMNSLFDNIRISENTHAAIQMRWLSDCAIGNFDIIGNTESGLVISDCQNCYFVGMGSISNGRTGIQIQGDDTSGVTLKNSNASHNGWDGLKVISGNKCSVVNCMAIANDAHGINLTVVDYINITNCFSNKNEGNGIFLNNGGARCKIIGNTCNDNGEYGIFLNNVEEKHIVCLNTCLGNTSGQILDSSTGSEVSLNILT